MYPADTKSNRSHYELSNAMNYYNCEALEIPAEASSKIGNKSEVPTFSNPTIGFLNARISKAVDFYAQI